ncbi:hypothetical protein [Mesorhizobium sp. KR1-2]|uniref:hypothetical protein n=1 Tax=Mesorhizobium sp. KR1-2 TaxID=3156609 RepID=UPI0032B4BC4D
MLQSGVAICAEIRGEKCAGGNGEVEHDAAQAQNIDSVRFKEQLHSVIGPPGVKRPLGNYEINIYEIKPILAYIHTTSMSVAKKLHKTIETDFGYKKLGKSALNLAVPLAFQGSFPCVWIESPCGKF